MVFQTVKRQPRHIVTVMVVMGTDAVRVVRVVVPEDVALLGMVVFEMIEISAVVGRILNGEYLESRASIRIVLARVIDYYIPVSHVFATIT